MARGFWSYLGTRSMLEMTGRIAMFHISPRTYLEQKGARLKLMEADDTMIPKCVMKPVWRPGSRKCA
jgi:hypothetical protein